MNWLNKLHDYRYVTARNKNIPAAEKHANQLHGERFRGGKKADRDRWSAAWSRTFHKKMNELCAGL